MSALQVIQKLNYLLEQKSIRYCHWKGNANVGASVEGRTSLDILVDENEKVHLQQILSAVGFKYFAAIPGRRYVDIDDYLAVDAETGILVYLHLYYRLELQEELWQSYRLPWEELLLSSRSYSDEHHIYVAEPHMATIILVVRAAVKVRTRDRLNNLVVKDDSFGNLLRELSWLKARIATNKIQQLSQKLLGNKATQLVLDVIENESNLKLLLKPGNEIQLALKKFQYNQASVFHLVRKGNFKDLLYLSFKNFVQAPVTIYRRPVNHGRIITFLGADGSGKSTVTAEITKYFSAQIDVLPVYLGSWDGPASWFRLPLIWASQAAKILRAKRSHHQPHKRAKLLTEAGTSPPKSQLSKLGKILWATTLVYEKQNKLQQSQKARARGKIVICDRYPQNQILGFNDGPLLSNSQGHNSSYPRFLQAWELQRYQYMVNTIHPDLVIKLNITPEVAVARKPEEQIEIVRQKVAAVKSMTFPPQTIVVNIDATQTLDEVLLQVKQAIWKHL